LLLSIILAVEVLSELGVGYVLRRALLALPFMLAALPLLFTVEGEVLFRLQLGPWALAPTVPGLERFASLALKSWISVQAGILLAATTCFPDLLAAMRAIGFPGMLVSIFGLMWRYLFVLADEAMRLHRARLSRSGQSNQAGLRLGGSLSWRARVTGGMAGSLFLRAFERSDRIYMAMVSRGYDGEARGLPMPRLRAAHWLLLMISLVFFALLLVFGSLFA
jgi:cobalt/nickel transport system permease protein